MLAVQTSIQQAFKHETLNCPATTFAVRADITGSHFFGGASRTSNNRHTETPNLVIPDMSTEGFNGRSDSCGNCTGVTTAPALAKAAEARAEAL